MNKIELLKKAIDIRLNINPEIKDSEKMLVNLTKFLDSQLSINEYIELIAYIETFKQGVTK